MADTNRDTTGKGTSNVTGGGAGVQPTPAADGDKAKKADNALTSTEGSQNDLQHTFKPNQAPDFLKQKPGSAIPGLKGASQILGDVLPNVDDRA